MDITREIDIRQLHEAREQSSNRKERETIEKAMYNIEKQSRNPAIAHAREELINAHRNHAVEDTHRIEEQIRDLER
jgi:hypothetical protein